MESKSGDFKMVALGVLVLLLEFDLDLLLLFFNDGFKFFIFLRIRFPPDDTDLGVLDLFFFCFSGFFTWLFVTQVFFKFFPMD